MKFVGLFAYWLSTAANTITAAIAKYAKSYEEGITRLEASGKLDEADKLKVDKAAAMEEAKVEACRTYLEQFIEQYGDDFVNKLIQLAKDEQFNEFFVDMAAAENLKAVTLDPTIPADERMTARSRADRATGALIPLEIMKELAEKNEYVTEFEKEVDEQASVSV